MDCIIIGRKSLGKSTCALHVASKATPYIAIFDPCAQFEIFPTVHAPEQLRKAMDEDELTPIVYQPEGDAGETFPAFADAVWAWPRMRKAAIVDEASELQTPQGMEEHLSRLTRQGHRYNISVIQTAHRPPDLHRRVWAMASHFLFFRTHDYDDLERISKHCSVEVAERVARLPRYHCLVWSEANMSFVVWDHPEHWYCDIHGKEASVNGERPEGEARPDAVGQAQAAG